MRLHSYPRPRANCSSDLPESKRDANANTLDKKNLPLPQPAQKLAHSLNYRSTSAAKHRDITVLEMAVSERVGCLLNTRRIHDVPFPMKGQPLTNSSFKFCFAVSKFCFAVSKFCFAVS